jgi:hypothetical protein
MVERRTSSRTEKPFKRHLPTLAHGNKEYLFVEIGQEIQLLFMSVSGEREVVANTCEAWSDREVGVIIDILVLTQPGNYGKGSNPRRTAFMTVIENEMGTFHRYLLWTSIHTIICIQREFIYPIKKFIRLYYTTEVIFKRT